jgi:hypothetical protein
MQLSVDEVMKLAPDDSSAKAAKGLVVPAKWPTLGQDDLAIWGECKGSGSKPYQVQVDKNGPAFRCSCPSRKFPCKHGLALLLLLAQQPAAFGASPPPAWVAEWLASRRQRAEKQEQAKAKAAEAPAAPADPEAAARREAARLKRMAEGLDDLERWLADRLRQGLAQLPAQPEIWDETAARMVDAQLPGMALRLRRAGERIQGENWPARVLAQLGQMQLLIEAFRRLDKLPSAQADDVRTALGLPPAREAVLAEGERVADDWFVLGQSIEEEDRLWVRRVWLRGQRSGRDALLLDYAHGSRRFEAVYITSSRRTMTLAFYPGAGALRAIPLDDGSVGPAEPPAATLAVSLDRLANALAANPWQWPQPLLADDGVPRRDASGWSLSTGAGTVPLGIADADGWPIVAESGGWPLLMFGEWDGETLRPLSCWRKSALVWTREAEPQ